MTLSILPVTGVPMVRPGRRSGRAALRRPRARRGSPSPTATSWSSARRWCRRRRGAWSTCAAITPSAFARQLAAADGRQGRRASSRSSCARPSASCAWTRGHLIVETGPGWVCANAGVDESNSGDPRHRRAAADRPGRLGAPHRRARRASATAAAIAVIVTDTFGRPWRQGLVDFALGVAGMAPLLDLRGSNDLDGRELHHTVLAQADALAAAAGLVMRKGAAHPRRAGPRLRVHAGARARAPS